MEAIRLTRHATERLRYRYPQADPQIVAQRLFESAQEIGPARSAIRRSDPRLPANPQARLLLAPHALEHCHRTGNHPDAYLVVDYQTSGPILVTVLPPDWPVAPGEDLVLLPNGQLPATDNSLQRLAARYHRG